MTLFYIFISLMFVYALVSKRLEASILTAPMIFSGAGILVYVAFPILREQIEDPLTFLTLAEVALVMLLFADASRTDLRVLKNIHALPTRLLSVGMLLTIALGIVIGRLVFPILSWWEAGILSAILAPTDASLGLVVVNSPRVPMKIRQSLNVEAGLNDGLSVPFMFFFIGLATAGSGGAQASLFHYMVEQLGYGAMIGVALGLVGGWLLGQASKHGWMQESMSALGVVVVPTVCLLVSEHVGASAFIAAFVAGLASQKGFPKIGNESVEFTEGWGQALSLSVFFLFGLFAARRWQSSDFDFDFGVVLYAILSLTIVRMLPVAISLWSTGLSLSTKLFMGWFGPRGLASLVLAMVVLQRNIHLANETLLRNAINTTVLLSIFAHGATAIPGIGWYAKKVETFAPDAPELSADAPA